MSVIDTLKGALPEIPRPELSLPDLSAAEARKPFYAVVGAGDLAVAQAREQVKELREQLPKIQDLKLQDLKLQEQIPALPKTAQAKATEYVADVTGYVSSLPSALATLKVQASPTGVKALNQKVAFKATALYADLAGRGEKIVDLVLAQPSTKAAEKAVQDAVTYTKVAVSQAKDAAKQAETAVRSAAGKIGVGASTPSV